MAMVLRESCLGAVIVRVCAFHWRSMRIVSRSKSRSSHCSPSSSPGRAADQQAVSRYAAKLGGVSSVGQADHAGDGGL
jgi:hypothetical protein